MTAAQEVLEESRPRFARGVRLADSQAQDGTVLLAPERVFKPDPIALAILQHCDGTSSVAQIVDRLAALYDAPRERLMSDVKMLLGSLADKRLLEL